MNSIGSELIPLFMQDVDTAFLNKSDLEANVDALAQEVEFLKALYLEVRLFSKPLRMRLLSMHTQRLSQAFGFPGTGFIHLVPPPLRPVCSLSECVGVRKARDYTEHLHSHVKPDSDLLSCEIQTFIGQAKG